MAEPQIPQPFVMRVRPGQKLRNKIYAEKREQHRLAMMAAAGRAPSIVYKCPCKLRKTTASERAAMRASRKNTARTTTAVTAGE
ncbi:hypothetical protein Tco_0180261 [Tanacetum coccineum]